VYSGFILAPFSSSMMRFLLRLFRWLAVNGNYYLALTLAGWACPFPVPMAHVALLCFVNGHGQGMEVSYFISVSKCPLDSRKASKPIANMIRPISASLGLTHSAYIKTPMRATKSGR
jgi:hypothetical protein